ncbi:MAG TPA: hypothetical protein VMU93_07825 [Caulobacteraceae bacterium]|nr:hypothetical protein [Caulobacteraceae bacterium]
MPRLSLAFFSAAVLYGLIGMGWGAQMGMTENFTLAAAHAHLNLLGWVTLSLMGGFYALAGARAPTRLGWANFTLSNLGVIVMIPALARLLSGERDAGGVVVAGTVITILGMLTFAAAVLSLWGRPAADQSALARQDAMGEAGAWPQTSPAEPRST